MRRHGDLLLPDASTATVRRAFEQVQAVFWVDFIRSHKTRWAQNRRYSPGQYEGTSLRELIAFALDPEPTAEQIEYILKRQTVRWTIRHGTPQLFVLSSIIGDGLPNLRRATIGFETSLEVDYLLAAGVDAYLEGRITRSALRAVMKLHSIAEPGEFLKLTRKGKVCPSERRLNSGNVEADLRLARNGLAG